MDQIKIKDLEVFAKHGAFPEENVLGQKFLISAVLYTDTRKAGKTDDLTASIHYGEVCAMITEFMREHTFQLIERVVEELADMLLRNVEHLKQVTLEVKKPWAPIGLPVDYVSVEITRSWHTVYLALGSNMGDKEAFLKGAVKALDETDGCRVLNVSDFMETAPYGVTDQDVFLNGCLELRTLLSPQELLEELHRIEAEAGRERSLRWGPRTLDLDILFYDDVICQQKHLCIPHVDMRNRDFVLKPLEQIAPYKRHPATGLTVREMLNELNDWKAKQ